MITDKHVIEAINGKLLDEYRVLDGRPIYRIVWSDDELELRKGVYNEFYGHIFIRSEKKVKWIKKYWYVKNPCWILEKLVFIAGQTALKEMQDELIQSRNGTYEPVYPFKDKNDNPLPVAWEIVDAVVWSLMNPGRIDPARAKAAVEAEEREEVAFFEEQFGKDERSPLFVFENSSFVSSNQKAFRESARYHPESEQYVEKSEVIDGPNPIIIPAA